jgi:hypothetical protein
VRGVALQAWDVGAALSVCEAPTRIQSGGGSSWQWWRCVHVPVGCCSASGACTCTCGAGSTRTSRSSRLRLQLQPSPWQSSAASGQWWPRTARAPRPPPVRSSGARCCSWQKARTAPQRQAHYECALVAVVSYLRHHLLGRCGGRCLGWTLVAEEEGHPEGGRSVAAEAAPHLALRPPLLPAAHHTGCARGR